MKLRITYSLLFCLFLSLSKAQIYCPNDITLSCFSELSLEVTGNATVVSGNYYQSMVKYYDLDETNACNEGTVWRTFYIDIDYSNDYTENEPSCTQTIVLEYDEYPLNIQFPGDKQFSCLDDIPVDHPTWSWNPCDLVGYTYKDEIFEFQEGACQKIVRTYTVINWCAYDANSGEGLYTGIQVLKIVDNKAPMIENCNNQVFEAQANCEAEIILVNSANDIGDCPSGLLKWTVSVDLWGDGTEDLFFGPNEPAPFRLAPVANGEEVKVVLPERVGKANHKVYWNVSDGCNNFTTCSSGFEVVDNKPPTPYCINYTGSTLNGADGGTLVIPATLFSLDAIDNCSDADKIILSFSENVLDTEKVIKCGDTGFQFFRIYYTDEAGNQDFCEVFMLVFDNGSCFGKFEPVGQAILPNGVGITDVKAELMMGSEMMATAVSDNSGLFSFGEQDLMDSYEASLYKSEAALAKVDLEDFVLMRSALLGISTLNYYQRIAADVNRDMIFDIKDLYAFRDLLNGKFELSESDVWTFIPETTLTTSGVLNYKEYIPVMEYGLGFNFIGIKTGDLTGASLEVEQGILSSMDVDLVFKIYDNHINVYNEALIQSEGYILEFIDGGDNRQKDINLETGSVILEHSLSFEIDGSYSSKSIEEILQTSVVSAQFLSSNGQSISNVNWKTIDKRTKQAAEHVVEKVSVFPTIFTDHLNITGTEIQAVEIYTLNGLRVNNRLTLKDGSGLINVDSNLPGGIYFVKVLTATDEKVLRVYKAGI